MNTEIETKSQEILELKAYLNSTDYVSIRAFETNTEVPEDILNLRAAARERINILESEIETLIELEQESQVPEE